MHAFLLEHAVFLAKHPQDIAIQCAGERLSYAELAESARSIASGLLAHGVTRGDVVVVWMRKSIHVPAVYFGLLDLGAAYAPLNAESPALYVRSVALHARARLVVVDDDVSPDVASSLGVPAVRVSEFLEPVSVIRGRRAAIDTDVAYVHFTSGSTGRPKGVAITHRASRAYLDICDAILKGGPDDVVLNHAPLAFDLSSFDLHLAMRWGAKLHMLRTEEALAPGSLLGVFASASPTVLYTVPTTLHRLASLSSIDRVRVPSLRALIFAGEPPNPLALRRLRPVFPNAVFHHWYGSTEAALVTAIAYPPGEELPERMPIGDPVPNVEIALEGEGGELEAVGPGARGELLVASTLLFDGYYGEPATTEAAFRLDAHRELPARPKRWFRTRDIVRCDADGNLHYEARRDRMVKVRGQRVDIEEITSVIRRHGGALGVAACAVVAREDLDVGARLYAFVTGGVDVAALGERLKSELPRYMLPERIVSIDELPTTPSGKVDHRALLSRVEGARS